MERPNAYSPFPIQRIALNDLLLDAKNSRIASNASTSSQQDILEYLVENEDLLKLAKQLCAEGYRDNELPVVTRQAQVHGCYVVLEGNRRVAVLKLLSDPSSAPYAIRTQISRLIADSPYQWNIDSIQVEIAPSRQSFQQPLARLHTTRSKRPWSRERQADFYFAQIINNPSLTVSKLKEQFANVPQGINKSINIRSARQAVYDNLNQAKIYGYTQLINYYNKRFTYSSFEYALEDTQPILHLQFDSERGLLQQPTTGQLKCLLYIADVICGGQYNTRSSQKRRKAFVQDVANILKESSTDITIRDEASNNRKNQPMHGAVAQNDSAKNINKSKGTKSRGALNSKIYHNNHLYTADLVNEINRFPDPNFPPTWIKRVEELQTLDYTKYCYTAILLIRNIFELFVVYYLRSLGREPTDGFRNNLNALYDYFKHCPKDPDISSYAQRRNKLCNALLEILGESANRSGRNDPLYYMNSINHDLYESVTVNNVEDIWNKVNNVLLKLLQITPKQ